MSRASKLTFAASVTFTSSMIFYVHFDQEKKKKERRQAVIESFEKEKERESRKEENLKRLREEQALNALLLEQRDKALNAAMQCLKKFQDNLNGVDKKTQVIDKLEVVCLSAGDVNTKVMNKYARSQNLIVHMWPFMPPANTYDVGLVVSFGKLIPSSVINSFRFGLINIHPSFIPKLRGAAPISRAIEAGFQTTGISILQVSPKTFDSGGILDQSEEISIENHVNSQDLSEILADVGGDLCLDTLAELPLKLENARPQNKSDISYAPKITLDDTVINWNTMTASQIWNKFRAFGFQKQFRLRCFYDNGSSVDVIKLANIEPVDSEDLKLPVGYAAGDVHFDKKSKKLIIGCKSGVIACLTLCVSNRRLQTAADFYNGFMQTRLKRGEEILFQNSG